MHPWVCSCLEVSEKMSNFTCLLKNVCLNYTKDKTGEVLHCMVFIRTMNIYTQLNVYMWMYLRNSRTVLIILIKSSVGKQGRKCLPFMLTIWSPPLPQLLHRHQKTHTCHTHRQTRTHVHKSSNALLTTSQRQSSNCCQ